jgi:hypothetical protein
MRRLRSPAGLPAWRCIDDNSLAAERARDCGRSRFFLSRHDCRAEVADGETVIVELPHVLHLAQARMEVELYVRLWQALHGVTVDLLP